MYTIRLKDIVKNNSLHDFCPRSIKIDCEKAVIHFGLEDPWIQECTLDIPSFRFFQIEHKEPWLEGEYIFGSKLRQGIEGHFRLTLTLNSGDEIIIDFENHEK